MPGSNQNRGVSDDDDSDDVPQGSQAHSLLQSMGKVAASSKGRHTSTAVRSKHGSSLSQSHMTATTPTPLSQHLDGLSRLISSTGIHAPIDTSSLELQLKQRAAVLIEARQNEIDAYASSLEAALSEVARIRAHEETRLAGRISEATVGFQQALSGLHKQYLEQVKVLERQAVEQLQQHRDDCDAAISSRVALLHEGIADRVVSRKGSSGTSARRLHTQEASLLGRTMGSPRQTLPSNSQREVAEDMSRFHNASGAQLHRIGDSNGGQVVRNLGGDGSWGSPIAFSTPQLSNGQLQQTPKQTPRSNTASLHHEAQHTTRQRNSQAAHRHPTSSLRQPTANEETRSMQRAALDLLGGSEGEASG